LNNRSIFSRPYDLFVRRTRVSSSSRVDGCDTCKTYIKSVDLSRNGLAAPIVDEIAAAPLDIWVQQRGYSKLQLNLMGM
jgi:formate dehydrogenase maturation protein FdhE